MCLWMFDASSNLDLQVSLSMDVEPKENQREEKLPALEENCHETRHNGAAPPVSVEDTKTRRHSPSVMIFYFMTIHVKFRLSVLLRQLNPKPSPLCYQKPYQLFFSQGPPLTTPTNTEETPQRTPPRWDWRTSRQSWENWGASLTKWRVNISTELTIILLCDNVPLALAAMWCELKVGNMFEHTYLCVPAKRSSCWWTSWMRRRGFVWPYRFDMERPKHQGFITVFVTSCFLFFLF